MTTGSGGTWQTSDLTLAAVPTAASCSRAFARWVLSRWRLAYLVDTAELVVSELVTNAVTATGTVDAWPRCTVVADDVNTIQVRLALAGSLFVGVWDCEEGVVPVIQERPDLGAERGRGLLLVEAMSKRWGHRPESGGKVVWCELDSAPPATRSGLPIRVPVGVPAQRRGDAVFDPDLLRRVLDRLRRLQY